MNQLFCLVAFTVTGISIGILFDVFRILRKSFKTADWLTTIQDILFWLLTGFIILFSIFKFNKGEIRSYIFVGIIFGIFIYILTLSKYVIKFSVIIIKIIKKIISYPINLVVKTFDFLIIKPTKIFICKINIFFAKILQYIVKIMPKKRKIKLNCKKKEGIL